MKTITKILIVSIVVIILLNLYLMGNTYKILNELNTKENVTENEFENNIGVLGDIDDPYSLKGYTEIKVDVAPQTIILSANCSTMSLPLNDLQVYSIKNALQKKIEVRPTTHDTFKALIDNYNITLELVKITEMKDDVYLSDMIFRNGDKVLNLDAKPSDAIAIALRTVNKIYMKKSILEKSGKYSC